LYVHLQKRNFDKGVLGCQTAIVIPPGERRSDIIKMLSGGVSLVYTWGGTGFLSALLKRKLEDKFRATQPAFTDQWAAHYGSRSNRSWYGSHSL
jgi:hypothetical protein